MTADTCLCRQRRIEEDTARLQGLPATRRMQPIMASSVTNPLPVLMAPQELVEGTADKSWTDPPS
jgi:hypothetical protein